MARKATKYSCLPSKRNGHELTEQDRIDIGCNLLKAIADLKGYSKIDIYDTKGNYIRTM